VLRRPFSVLLWVLVVVALAFGGLAWGQSEPSVPFTLPAAGGSFVVNVSDLTFPSALFLGLWMVARALPGALRSWTPTLRVELVDERAGEPAESRT
jgi:hypothetical protein